MSAGLTVCINDNKYHQRFFFPVQIDFKMASQRPVPQDFQQKAEEFWNELKDLKIPDVTTGNKIVVEDIW